ncbi:hypothetical protein [Cohnella kolymensis]|uniref:hypothetical protein n=1 Tax=Cohnella kolymensis TaxID=1590652 RepID=UPI001F3E0BD0|nr:hypothetical protein [Cohnella kolymensis]
MAVKAAARILPMSAAKGAVPLGIDSRIALNYNQPYRLKVDMEGSDTGFFGILALGGPGAKTYEQNLKNGYSYEIKVGDIIETETGKVEGKTRDGVNFRIDSDPYPEGDYNHRDSTRVILIPVYEPYEQTSNQMKRIKVVGFAYFYILEPMSHQDSEINGYFIERADTAFASPGTPDTGAYAIKLVE